MHKWGHTPSLTRCSTWPHLDQQRGLSMPSSPYALSPSTLLPPNSPCPHLLWMPSFLLCLIVRDHLSSGRRGEGDRGELQRRDFFRLELQIEYLKKKNTQSDKLFCKGLSCVKISLDVKIFFVKNPETWWTEKSHPKKICMVAVVVVCCYCVVVCNVVYSLI